MIYSTVIAICCSYEKHSLTLNTRQMVLSKQNCCFVAYQPLVNDLTMAQRLQKAEHSKDAVHGQTHETPPGGSALVILCDFQL